MLQKKRFLVLLTTLLFVCGHGFLFGFFTPFKLEDNYFSIPKKGPEGRLLVQEIRQKIEIPYEKKVVEQQEKVIFVLFYKKESREYLDFPSLEYLAQHMAKHVAGEKNIVLQIVPLEYKKKTFFLTQYYQVPADALAAYLADEKLFSGENQKLIIYTVSDSMYSVALATDSDTLPNNSIHTILSLDAEATASPNFDKIAHRLYGFYGTKTKMRWLTLWQRFFKKGFDSKKLFTKAVNVRCLYEKVTQEKPKIRQVVEVPFYDLFSPESNRAFARLVARIDEKYKLNNDLTAILFSDRKEYWEGKLPLVFMHNMLRLGRVRKGLVLKNTERDYQWRIDAKMTKQIGKMLEKEAAAHLSTVRTLYDYLNVTKAKNPELFNLFTSHKKKYSSFYLKTFKGVLQTLGIRYTPYEPEKNIIGPFFIPKEEELYVVVLAKEEVADLARVQIKLDNWLDPAEFDIKLPFKYGYAVLKKKVTDFGGHSYKITPANTVAGERQEIEGTIPDFVQIDPNTPYSFFVYGDLRKHDRSRLHKKVKDTVEETSVAYKTKEMFTKEMPTEEMLKDKRGIFHLLTGDLIVDGSSPHDWAEFLDVVLHPLTRDTLMISAAGNHDLTSSMGVSLLWYRYYFHPAVPHFGNIFYFTKKVQSQEPKKITVTEHVAKTKNWFDVGAVRFIHLPLPTEETRGHYEEIRHSKIDETRSWLTGMTCCNFDKTVWQAFERHVQAAHGAKKGGAIKFIVVYGHAPLATAPAYKMHHQGIFNFMIENRGNEKSLKGIDRDKYEFASALERIFKKYSIDAYFCGHNHLYDRCAWKIDEKTSIPMVTMGVGTGLHGLKLKKPNENLTKQITSHRLLYKKEGKAEFIGFLECMVLPDHGKIICSLYGSPGGTGKVAFVGESPIRKDVKDAFVINARVAR